MPDWLNTCIPGSIDFEDLINSLTNFVPSEPDTFLDDGSVTSGEEPPAVVPPTSPASTMSSMSSDNEHKSGASLPRHKRPSHKRAELKRRDKIKVGNCLFKCSLAPVCHFNYMLIF